MSRQSRRNPGGPRRPPRPAAEWAGGRIDLPEVEIKDKGRVAPAAMVWVDVSSGEVLAARVFTDDAAPTLADVLGEAMQAPLAGKPRVPARVRVATDELAAQVRAALAPDIAVVTAPTPELEDVGRYLTTMLNVHQERHDDLADETIPPDLVERLFAAAGDVFDLAPWENRSDDDILRLDIPAYGIHGAVISIVGGMEETLGVAVFPDTRAFQAFSHNVAFPPERTADSAADPTPILILTFDDEEDVAPGLRLKAAAHGWPLPEPDVYPVLEARDRDVRSQPLASRDVRIMAACLEALSTFFEREPEILAGEADEPVSGEIKLAGGVVVSITWPYEGYEEFEDEVAASRPATRVARAGRNDPCPCGSGKKYKRCHLPADEDAAQTERAPEMQEQAGQAAQRAAGVPEPGAARVVDPRAARASNDPMDPPQPQEVDRSAIRAVEGQLLDRIIHGAFEQFGAAWKRTLVNLAEDEQVFEGLTLQWAAYHTEIRGYRVLDWFLKSNHRSFSAEERAWLDAQRPAWLSLWEVQDVEPGTRVAVRDLLSGASRDVFEQTASRTLVHRDVVLARVVDVGGLSLFAGVHPRPLPPEPAAEVVERCETRLRHRVPLPEGFLRKWSTGRFLLQCWEEAVLDFDASRSVPPRLHNTDGDPLVQTIDHFRLAPQAREAVERALATLEGVERVPEEQVPNPGLGRAFYEFSQRGNAMNRPLEWTLLACIEVNDAALQVETNSTARADRVRAMIELACGAHLTHESRDEKSLDLELQHRIAARGRPLRSADPAPGRLPSTEAAATVLEYKRHFYADWADTPVPALGGKTPRAAARLASERGQVDVLLKSMENHEARLPAAERFNFSALRRDLGLTGTAPDV